MMIPKTHIWKSVRERYLHNRTRGFSLMEFLLVLGLFALFSILLISMQTDNAAKTRAKALADRMTIVTDATKAYLKANYAALQAAAPNPGSALVIPVAKTTINGASPSAPAGFKSLQDGGFLASNFLDVNSFKQQTAVLVRKCGCSTNALEVMLTTYGGQTIPDNLLGLSATTLGASGGYTPAKYVNSADNGEVIGAYGGWRTVASQWGSGAPQPGTLQATMAFSDGALLADYLYRDDIGIPDANTMHTNINVNNNQLNNVNTISAGPSTEVALTGSLRASIDIYARNAYLSGSAQAVGDITSTKGNIQATQGSVSAGVDVNAAAAVNSASLNTTGVAKVGDLQATYINADTVVYNGGSSTFALGKGDGIRLGDLLPKSSSEYSYKVTPTDNRVLKPVCNKNLPNDFSRARIFIYRQTESYQVNPNIVLSPSYTTADGQTVVASVVGNNAASTVSIASAILATDMGSYWNVSWVGDNPSPGATRQALAQTFCFFG